MRIFLPLTTISQTAFSRGRSAAAATAPSRRHPGVMLSASCGPRDPHQRMQSIFPWIAYNRSVNNKCASCAPRQLHSERLVPVDEETQRVVARIVEVGALTPRSRTRVPSFLTASLLATWDWRGVAQHLAIGPDCKAALVGQPHGYGTPSRQRWCAWEASRRLCK